MKVEWDKLKYALAAIKDKVSINMQDDGSYTISFPADKKIYGEQKVCATIDRDLAKALLLIKDMDV